MLMSALVSGKGSIIVALLVITLLLLWFGMMALNMRGVVLGSLESAADDLISRLNANSSGSVSGDMSASATGATQGVAAAGGMVARGAYADVTAASGETSGASVLNADSHESVATGGIEAEDSTMNVFEGDTAVSSEMSTLSRGEAGASSQSSERSSSDSSKSDSSRMVSAESADISSATASEASSDSSSSSETSAGSVFADSAAVSINGEGAATGKERIDGSMQKEGSREYREKQFGQNVMEFASLGETKDAKAGQAGPASGTSAAAYVNAQGGKAEAAGASGLSGVNGGNASAAAGSVKGIHAAARSESAPSAADYVRAESSANVLAGEQSGELRKIHAAGAPGAAGTAYASGGVGANGVAGAAGGAGYGANGVNGANGTPGHGANGASGQAGANGSSEQARNVRAQDVFGVRSVAERGTLQAGMPGAPGYGANGANGSSEQTYRNAQAAGSAASYYNPAAKPGEGGAPGHPGTNGASSPGMERRSVRSVQNNASHSYERAMGAAMPGVPGAGGSAGRDGTSGYGGSFGSFGRDGSNDSSQVRDARAQSGVYRHSYERASERYAAVSGGSYGNGGLPGVPGASGAAGTPGSFGAGANGRPGEAGSSGAYRHERDVSRPGQISYGNNRQTVRQSSSYAESVQKGGASVPGSYGMVVNNDVTNNMAHVHSRDGRGVHGGTSPRYFRPGSKNFGPDGQPAALNVPSSGAAEASKSPASYVEMKGGSSRPGEFGKAGQANQASNGNVYSRKQTNDDFV